MVKKKGKNLIDTASDLKYFNYSFISLSGRNYKRLPGSQLAATKLLESKFPQSSKFLRRIRIHYNSKHFQLWQSFGVIRILTII